MKQKRIILDTVNPENSASKLPQSIKFYINTNRDKLEYKDGSIPFSITTFNKFGLYAPDFVELYSIGKTGKERITKKYILSNYYVYRIADYGNQSLSPGSSDFIPFCYDSTGAKLPQYMIGIIRNYTTKEAFIIIKKDNLTINESISIIIDYKRNANVKVLNKEIRVDRESNVFSFNLATSELDTINTLAFFVKDNDIYYELKNSNYLFNIDDFKYSSTDGSKFVTQQNSYFNLLEFAGDLNKTYHSVDLILNDNLADINTIYIRDRKNYANYYFATYENLRTNVFYKLENLSVYTYNEGTERLERLVPAIDFYIDSDNKLVINGATDTTIYEVFIRPVSSEVFSFYSISDAASFIITDALHDNNFAKWKPDVTNSTVIEFTAGLFVKDSHGATVTTSTTGTEYIIEDITWLANTDPDIYPSTMTASLEASPNEFDNFNKYQITTDPYFNTYGETSITDISEQEVYLYDTSLNFLLDDAEPFITSDSGLTIQDIVDPYPALFTTVNANYTDFQNTYKVSSLLLDINAQLIETQISKLKKNYQALISNSTITYTNYVSLTNIGEFLFLVLKGTSGNKFNLTYRDVNDVIIKREYNCTLDSNGLYISLPFFFDTFSNTEDVIKFEVDQNVLQYYIFK